MDNINLKKSTYNAMFWKLAERIGAQTVSLIIQIMLARILSPDDYSVVSIVAIFFAFANVIISGGLNTALIQKKDAEPEDYATVFVVSVALSVLLYGILFFFAGEIARIYDKPILLPVIRVMSLTLIVNAAKSVVSAYTSNTLQFRKFFFATIIGTIFSAAIGIYLALQGAGPWALVVQQMTNSTLDTIFLFITTKFRVLLVFSYERFKSLFSYGWKILVASLISTAYNEIYPLVIGLKYTTADLAFFSKGESFPKLINSTLSNTFSSVLFPVMSKIQDEKERLLQYTRSFIGTCSFFILPIMLGLFAISDNFISILLTDKWLSASFYLKTFCLVYALEIIQTGNLQVIRAVGRSDIILKLDIAKKGLYAIVIALFLFFGKSPKSLAYAAIINNCIATVINTVPNIKLIGYSYKKQIQDILPNFISAAVMCVFVFVLNNLPINKFLLVAIQIVLGFCIYIGFNIIIKNPNMKFVRSFISSRTKKNKE